MCKFMLPCFVFLFYFIFYCVFIVGESSKSSLGCKNVPSSSGEGAV